MTERYRFDLHIHSHHSEDSCLEVGEILKIARARGLHGVAICDHGTVRGSLEAAARNPYSDLLVIPAAEYATEIGHIIGYFLQGELQLPAGGRGCSWRQVVDAIRVQGGLVFIAHPFKRRSLMYTTVWDNLDGIEVYNARVALRRRGQANWKAREASNLTGLPFSAGSDAHTLGEIGRAGVELALDQLSLEAVREALLARRAEVWGSPAPLGAESYSQLMRVGRRREWQWLPQLLLRALYVLPADLCHRLSGRARKMERWN